MPQPKKILIIPSWYPTKKEPLKGSFFREQAEFLDRSIVGQILIMYGEEQSTPFFKLAWIYILSFVKSTWPIQKESLIQSPNAYGFFIPANRRFPERLRVKFAIRLYQKAFLTLKAFGFAPDLIHAQSGMDAGIYAHDLSKIHNIPFVIIEHQVFVFHYYSRYKARLVLDAFEAAKKTAAVSFDERRQVLMNQPNCNPYVIWNLVEDSRYQIQLEKRNKVFTIITILNSLPIKGFDTFLEAMAELIKETHDIKFIMIGKGANEKSTDHDSNVFVKRSKELGIYNFGDFHPVIERDQIAEILNTSHVFVSPTIQEPHGIAAREAMMCGLPIISTANGGVEDSITKDTGLVVPVKDPMALAKAIFEIKVNLSHYDPNKIRRIAIEHCGSNKFLRQMTEFYI